MIQLEISGKHPSTWALETGRSRVCSWLSLTAWWALVQPGLHEIQSQKAVYKLLCLESFGKRSITKLCLLASALCCEDLPSGETQHQSPWVWRTLWTAPVALPSGEPRITHCCSESDISDCRTRVCTVTPHEEGQSVEKPDWWSNFGTHDVRSTSKSKFGAVQKSAVNG